MATGDGRFGHGYGFTALGHYFSKKPFVPFFFFKEERGLKPRSDFG